MGTSRHFYAAALALAGLGCGPVPAQTVLGVTLGEPIPEGLPAPLGTQTQAPFAQTVWDGIDGVRMAAIADIETGEVLFIELRPSTDAPASAQIEGVTFGETTREDLHTRFGSEGIVFADVGRAGAFGDLALYFSNYELSAGDIVVSFVTIAPLDGASDDSAPTSVLDSVIVAQGAYLNQVWGINRGRLPGYTRIENPFAE